MANSYKATAMARELQDRLKKRMGSLKVEDSFDTDGYPLLTISDGTPAAGEKVVVLKVAAISWPLVTDVLGLTQNVFTPHVIKMCTELNYAGATDNVADILTAADLLPVLGEVLGMGCKVEWYQTANGTVPSASAMVAANLKASFESLYYPMVMSQ